MQNQSIQERFPIVAVKVATGVDNTTVYGDPVNMADVGRGRFTLILNNVDTTSDGALQLCDSDGGNAVDIPEKVMTQASAGQSGKVIVLEIRNDEIPQATGQTHVRQRYTAGDGAAGNDVTLISELADVGTQTTTGKQSADVIEYIV